MESASFRAAIESRQAEPSETDLTPILHDLDLLFLL
eukprot:gene9569-56192_t